MNIGLGSSSVAVIPAISVWFSKMLTLVEASQYLLTTLSSIRKSDETG